MGNYTELSTASRLIERLGLNRLLNDILRSQRTETYVTSIPFLDGCHHLFSIDPFIFKTIWGSRAGFNITPVGSQFFTEIGQWSGLTLCAYSKTRLRILVSCRPDLHDARTADQSLTGCAYVDVYTSEQNGVPDFAYHPDFWNQKMDSLHSISES